MASTAITRQPPKISRYGNVTLLLWRAAGFGVVLDAKGRANRFGDGVSPAEMEAAIAPYLRAI
ncbi:hypothetical protein CKO11_13615 [Rhodobacter sp. TJ_12]|uniref:hypothetical protein n=1 Tax=Rhodobacter sp. TJ_12 TaxID=2029399 RepID=UPI001CBD454A|nr:hypothetical protein [Rhodobacter sp. TJ_12]MBZ4023494.1 hypothetical protein [Rhodobacter sp. TJ_12]